MLSTMLKIIALVLILIGVGWFGACLYSNFISEPDTGLPEMPSAEDAAYGVHIENTGNLLLTNDYEVHGEKEGSRVVVLHGFWQISGNNFKFASSDLILSESVFGKITIRRR